MLMSDGHDSSDVGTNQAHTEGEDLRNYKLARDRARRVPKPSSKFFLLCDSLLCTYGNIGGGA